MRSVWVLKTVRKAEYAELVALFFLQGAALGMWFVPLSTVLDANGLHAIKPFAFAATALAAFVSPLIFGAMADRQASPVVVLRGLSLATAAAMALASDLLRGRKEYVQHRIICRPHEALTQHLAGGTRFAASKPLELEGEEVS